MYLNLFLTNIGTNIVCYSICQFLFFLESLVNYESVNNDIRMPYTKTHSSWNALPFVTSQRSRNSSFIELIFPLFFFQLVSNSVMKDVVVAMTTVKCSSSSSSSTPGSPLHHELLSKAAIAIDGSVSRGYQGHQQLLHPASTYPSLGGPEPSLMGYPPTVAAPTSVGCNTTEDWEEETQSKQARLNHRGGARRSYRGGGRWRGSYDPHRGSNRKRCEGDAGPPLSYTHYNSSYRGRGRGY